MRTFHIDRGFSTILRLLGLLGVLVLHAAAAAGCTSPPSSEPVARVLGCTASQECPDGQTISCSSSGTVCTSGEDGDGLYVDCGSGPQYCPSPGGGGPGGGDCTCGATRYSVFVYDAHGSTCSEARSAARAQALAQGQCTYDACNESVATACELDPEGGYIGEAEYYYNCMSC
jgi:hypothetical protein